MKSLKFFQMYLMEMQKSEIMWLCEVESLGYAHSIDGIVLLKPISVILGRVLHVVQEFKQVFRDSSWWNWPQASRAQFIRSTPTRSRERLLTLLIRRLSKLYHRPLLSAVFRLLGHRLSRRCRL